MIYSDTKKKAGQRVHCTVFERSGSFRDGIASVFPPDFAVE